MKTYNTIQMLSVSLLLGGCTTFKNTKGLSTTEKANGANYQSSNAAGSFAVGNQLAPNVRKISGKVYCGHGLNQSPANNAQIELMQNSTTQFSGKTDANGSYVILQPIEPKKAYFLTAKSKCGETRTEVGFAKNAKDLTQDLYLGED